MTSKQSSEVETVGRWTHNMFLLFLTGGQALLLPWLPLILRGVGMAPVEIGLTLGSAGFVSTLSGYLFLRAVRRTRNGSLRRILLLFLVLISSIFFFTSALVASPPSAAFTRSCRLKSSPAGGALPPPSTLDELIEGFMPSSQNVSNSSPANATSTIPPHTEPPGETDAKGTSEKNPDQMASENETPKTTNAPSSPGAEATSSTPQKVKSHSENESPSDINPSLPEIVTSPGLKDQPSPSKNNPTSTKSPNPPRLKDEFLSSKNNTSSSKSETSSKFNGKPSSSKSKPSSSKRKHHHKHKSSSFKNSSSSRKKEPSSHQKGGSSSSKIMSSSSNSNVPPLGNNNNSFSHAGTSFSPPDNANPSYTGSGFPSSFQYITPGVHHQMTTGQSPTNTLNPEGANKVESNSTSVPNTSYDYYDYLDQFDDNDGVNLTDVKEVMPGVSVVNQEPKEIELPHGLPALDKGLPQRDQDLKQLREKHKEHFDSLGSNPDFPVESPHLPVPGHAYDIPGNRYKNILDHAYRKTPDNTYRNILDNNYRAMPGDETYRNNLDKTHRKTQDTMSRKMQDVYAPNEDRFPVDYDAIFRSFPGLRGREQGTIHSSGRDEAKNMGPVVHRITGSNPEFDDQVREPLLPPSGVRHIPYPNSHHNRKREASVSSSSEEQVTVATNTTDPSLNVKSTPEESSDLTKYTMMSRGHLYAAAVLVVLAYALGACVEYLVLKLRHCYTHGYDEVSREPLDIVEKTITYTFDFSMYGTHRSWSNLTSSAMLLMAASMLASACSFQISLAPPLVSLATMYFCLMGLALLSLMCVTIPFGSIDAPRTKRALSLYLDNEVLREGIRRLSFHCYVGVCGFITSLLFNFSLLLIEDLSKTPEGALMAQALTVAAWLMGEGLTVPASRWFISRLGILGIMGTSLWMLSFLLMVIWVTSSPWVTMAAHTILGVVYALVWIAIKYNSLLLATISDQENEVTVSWWVWRWSSAIGVAAWGAAFGHTGFISDLFVPAAAITAIAAGLVITVAITTRSERRSKRRVYHTLDLSDESEEDEDFLGKPEEDWLVKRASKEGISL